MAVGYIRVQPAGAASQVQAAADIENFAYETPVPPAAPRAPTIPVSQASAWATLWREPRLNLTFNGSYDANQDALEVQQMTAAGGAVQAIARGQITDATTVCRVNLTGEYDYDLTKLVALLRPRIGDDVTMTGRGPRPFTLQGPVLPPAVNSASAASAPLPQRDCLNTFDQSIESALTIGAIAS